MLSNWTIVPSVENNEFNVLTLDFAKDVTDSFRIVSHFPMLKKTQLPKFKISKICYIICAEFSKVTQVTRAFMIMQQT